MQTIIQKYVCAKAIPRHQDFSYLLHLAKRERFDRVVSPTSQPVPQPTPQPTSALELGSPVGPTANHVNTNTRVWERLWDIETGWGEKLGRFDVTYGGGKVV